MLFQRPGAQGDLVWKITSIESGASMANKLAEVSGVSGAGASASSNALVAVRTPMRVVKTRNLRWVFFTSTPVGQIHLSRGPRQTFIGLRFIGSASDNTARRSSDPSSVAVAR